jgi:hypothetical protein
MEIVYILIEGTGTVALKITVIKKRESLQGLRQNTGQPEEENLLRTEPKESK